MAPPSLGGALAVVTGGSRGIGAAAAKLLRAEGATVVRIARSLEPDTGPGWIDLRADLTAEVEADAAIEAVLRRGVPDLVVNNAGAFMMGPLETQTEEDLDCLFRVNVGVPFRIARAFLPSMRVRGSGRHILIGSVADHQAFPDNAAYVATKFAARGFHQTLRQELAGTGVLCSLISPGPVDTALWDPIDPDADPALPSRHTMLRAAEVAEAIRWIATLPPTVDVSWMMMEANRREDRG
jgi:3-oxoacyl-[acyl-carrier protein] reductase